MGAVSKRKTWLAMQIFRDWLASRLTELTQKANRLDMTSISRLYSTLLKGGDSYLRYDRVLQQLKENVPCGDWGEPADDLRLLKRYAADIVKGMCANNLMLDAEGTDIEYLTCAKTTDEDGPWLRADAEKD